jgi:hypothetical protein
MKKKEELTEKFQALLTKAVEGYNGDVVGAYAGLVDELTNQYILIPVEGDEVAKTIQENIFWLIQALRYEVQKDIAQLEALGTAEENPE